METDGHFLRWRLKINRTKEKDKTKVQFQFKVNFVFQFLRHFVQLQISIFFHQIELIKLN